MSDENRRKSRAFRVLVQQPKNYQTKSEQRQKHGVVPTYSRGANRSAFVFIMGCGVYAKPNRVCSLALLRAIRPPRALFGTLRLSKDLPRILTACAFAKRATIGVLDTLPTNRMRLLTNLRVQGAPMVQSPSHSKPEFPTHQTARGNVIYLQVEQ